MADILKASDRYDKLQDEFDLYMAKRGPIKLHSVEFLKYMLDEVTKRIKELEATQDDEYQSIKAALIRWQWLQIRIIKRIRIKTGKFRS